MISTSVITCLLAVQATPPLSPFDGVYGDSLLLLVLGIGLLLLSTLVKGMSVSPVNRNAEGTGDRIGALAAAPVIEVIPVADDRISNSSGGHKVLPLLSVDVEDYFQTEAFSSVAPRQSWDQYPMRVVDNTKRLLDLFDCFDAKATFFMLGWVADRAPQLVREIAARGHELACHSYWHRTIYSLSPEVFREDTRMAVQAIEDAGGTKIRGYRAPTWSITRESLWSIRILAAEGFEYDSSVYPVHHDLYGIPGAMVSPYVWKTDDHNNLVEIPPATFSFCNMTLPAAGGGYLRIFPLTYSRMAINQLSRSGHLPVVYLHPWEIDPDQPRLQGAWKSRARQYWGLDSFEGKLTQLLSAYHFVPFRQRYQDIAAQCPELSFIAGEELMAS